ncbi:MAG TPA: hypothetical protein VFR34_04355 [Paracoccaceae bacterium]|nr:hypothetical protein [Paracoccaceae bacterium]
MTLGDMTLGLGSDDPRADQPAWIVRTRGVLTPLEALIWADRVSEELKAQGAVHVRFSERPRGRQTELLVEGWLKIPRHPGEPRWRAKAGKGR